MFRILKLRKISPQSAYARKYSNPSSLILHRTCLLCNRSSSSKLRPGLRVRSEEFSTRVLAEVYDLLYKKKKGRKTKKIVSDLLSVDSFSVSESKAKVMKVTARDLSLAVKRPFQDLPKLSLSNTKVPNNEDLSLSRTVLKTDISSPSSTELSSSPLLDTASATGSSLVCSTSAPSDPLKAPDRLNQEVEEEVNGSTSAPCDPLKVLNKLNQEVEEGGSTSAPCDPLEVPNRLKQEVEEEVTGTTTETRSAKNSQNYEGKSSSKKSKKKKREAHPEDERNLSSSKKSRKKKGDARREEKAERWKEWVSQYEAQKMVARQQHLSRRAESLLQVYVNNGMLKQAYSTLLSLCTSNSQPKIPAAFEIVLKGCAERGSLETLKAVLDMMRSYEVPLSIGCYSACLECVGRSKEDSDRLELVQSLLDDMAVHGYKTEDLFTRCKYVKNQKEVVLNMIRLIDPKFTPVTHPPEMDYKVKLLDALKDLKISNKESYQSPAMNVLSVDSLNSLVDEQIANEEAGCVSVPNVVYPLDSRSCPETLKVQDEMDDVWRKCIERGFRRDLIALKSVRLRKSLRLDAYLHSIPESDLVNLTLMEVKLRINDSVMFSAPLTHLYNALGEKVKKQHDVLRMKNTGQYDKVVALLKEYCHWYVEPDKFPSGPTNPRQIWQTLEFMHQDGSDLHVHDGPWPYSICQDIGHFLYNIIFRDIKIDVHANKESLKPHLVPAFYSIFRYNGYCLQEQLKIHPAVSKAYHPNGQQDLLMDTSMLPMVSPPKPWVSTRSGGFSITQVSLVRLPAETVKSVREATWEALGAVPVEQLYGPLDALNQLGSIPWKVNTRVLDIVLQVFRAGGSASLDIPSPPSTLDAEIVSVPIKNRWRRRAHLERFRRQKAEMYSLWCDALYKLCLANYFRDKIFWLPHNMDFRGRVYPIAPHLHHMGSDMPRSLLLFAKGEKLGPTGLDWLKIHAVNLTGMKKRETLKERLEFANEMLPKIMESADDPLTGEKWWKESEEPWQTLAACIEIAAAIRSGDPENYVCHLPVHQDGSCNGLQHYAALGRDSEGAASVNLAALDVPADVYSCVSELVERQRAKDAKNGVPLAQKLEGYVSRKVVKQTVMTTVYGVTSYGARLQIASRLKDMGFPDEKVRAASTYLAKLTFDSIGEMFTSTRKIQDWLTESARMIARSAGGPVEWTTPLGLPVIQPYFKSKKVPNLHKMPSKKALEDSNFGKPEVPNVMKQRNGFPPNFIHSLDSCHMMLTSLFCEQSAITYASVHDCFWIHPCNVERLNKICRDQFVALHTEPILEDLSESLLEKFCPPHLCEGNSANAVELRYLKRLLTKVPKKGTFNLNEVLKSTYFFS